MSDKYFGNFMDAADVKDQFRVPDDEFPTDDQILIAAYETPDYEGFATVIFEKDGEDYAKRYKELFPKE